MPFLALLTSLVVLSQSALLIRLASTHAVAIGFWRMALALPFFVLLLFWQKRWKEVASLSSSQWLRLFFCGFFLFAHFYTWFLSVQRTSLAHSMILFCANPLFTALGAWFFYGEKASWRHAFALLLCFTGIYFLLSDKTGAHTLEGDLLGILCSVLFSAYVLVSLGVRKSLANAPFALVTYSFCALFFFLLMLGLGLPFLGYSANAWIAFAGLAFGSTILGHSLFTKCLEWFHVNLLSISTLVEPLFTAFTGYLFFQEPITRGGVIGFLFVGTGIFSLYLPYLKAKLQR